MVPIIKKLNNYDPQKTDVGLHVEELIGPHFVEMLGLHVMEMIGLHIVEMM